MPIGHLLGLVQSRCLDEYRGSDLPCMALSTVMTMHIWGRAEGKDQLYSVFTHDKAVPFGHLLATANTVVDDVGLLCFCILCQ